MERRLSVARKIEKISLKNSFFFLFDALFFVNFMQNLYEKVVIFSTFMV